jgi:hypothetical protein
MPLTTESEEPELVAKSLQLLFDWLASERERADNGRRAERTPAMMLDEVKTNGHAEPVTRAWDASLARIERRVAELGETNEQRITVLRDAIGEFVGNELAQRDDEIEILKKRIATLQEQLAQKTAIDQQVDEIQKRLDEKAAQRDEAKRGPPGRQGERGARGERGLRGARGPAGKPASERPALIIGWKVDAERYRAVPYLADGRPGAELNLRPLFERFVAETGGS